MEAKISIEISLKGKTITLDETEAMELYQVLHKVFRNKICTDLNWLPPDGLQSKPYSKWILNT